jgi:hypothetical protein
MTTFYIGTEKEYKEGDLVTEKVFYTDLELAKERAQWRAQEFGMLFGNVYEISHEVDETPEDFAVRFPHRVIAHVGYSI